MNPPDPSSPPPSPPMPTPPDASGWRPPDLAAAGRRASTLMWVLGVVGVLFGLCAGAASSQMTPERIAELPQGEQMLQVERQAGVTLKSFYLGMALVAIAVGGVLGGLAFPVRRGSLPAAVAGLVGVILVGLFLLLSMVGGLSMGPTGLLAICVLLLPIGLCGLLVIALVQAIAAPRPAYHPPPQHSPHPFPRQPFPQHPAPPPASPPYPSPATPYANPPAAGTRYPVPPPGLFGPAPVGVPPPPPDDAPPAGRYGYATRPPSSPPPSSSAAAGRRPGGDGTSGTTPEV